MPLYEITGDGLVHHQSVTFTELELLERADLQRLLRDDISVLAEDLLVVAESSGSGRTPAGESTSWPWTGRGISSSSS